MQRNKEMQTSMEVTPLEVPEYRERGTNTEHTSTKECPTQTNPPEQPPSPILESYMEEQSKGTQVSPMDLGQNIYPSPPLSAISPRTQTFTISATSPQMYHSETDNPITKLDASCSPLFFARPQTREYAKLNRTEIGCSPFVDLLSNPRFTRSRGFMDSGVSPFVDADFDSLPLGIQRKEIQVMLQDGVSGGQEDGFNKLLYADDITTNDNTKSKMSKRAFRFPLNIDLSAITNKSEPKRKYKRPPVPVQRGNKSRSQANSRNKYEEGVTYKEIYMSQQRAIIVYKGECTGSFCKKVGTDRLITIFEEVCRQRGLLKDTRKRYIVNKRMVLDYELEFLKLYRHQWMD